MNADTVRALDTVRLAAASGSQRIAFDGVDADTYRMLRFASQIGAPVTLAADLAHRRITDSADVSRSLAVASAEARSVAAFLLVAPVLLLPLTGRVLGIAIGNFFTQPAGRIVLAVACLLYLAGFAVIWQLQRQLHAPVSEAQSPPISRLLLVVTVVSVAGGWLALAGVAATLFVLLQARKRPTEPVMLHDLAAAADVLVVAVTAGQSLPHALEGAAQIVPSVARQLRQIGFALACGVEPQMGAGTLGQFATIAWHAHHNGAQAAHVFRQFSAQIRADERAVLLARTSRLPARLTVPTTLFFLPATVLVMIAPVVAHGLTVLSW